MKNFRQAPAVPKLRKPTARRSVVGLAALVLALLLVPTMPVPAEPGGTTEAGRLYAALTRMTKLANHRVRPPVLRLARNLPSDAGRLDRLRESASTAQTEVKATLDELRQVGSLAALDPHYLPALVAAGRAYVAVSGKDPVTATTINPDYLGLEPELEGNAAQLRHEAEDAGTAADGIKTLTQELIRSKRRAHRLEGEIRRLHASSSLRR